MYGLETGGKVWVGDRKKGMGWRQEGRYALDRVSLVTGDCTYTSKHCFGQQVREMRDSQKMTLAFRIISLAIVLDNVGKCSTLDLSLVLLCSLEGLHH